ncbi:MAG: hypothetical protein ACYS1C_05620 [Planctomycetota bacterium]
MNAKVAARMVLTVMAFAAFHGVARAQEPDAPAPESPREVEAAPTEGVIQMAELALEGRRVRGRVVSESDVIIRVESPGSGVIGYHKDAVEDLRRFTLSARAYFEGIGDYYQGAAWEADDAPAAFRKARQAYLRALAHGEDEAQKSRLTSKLEAVAADREEWQREAMRREELEKIRHEKDLARLEKELTAERLAAIQRHEQQIEQLWQAVRDLDQHRQSVLAALDQMGHAIEELHEDVDHLRHRDRVFIRSTVFLDLKRAHERLQREVDRLERMVQGK